MIVKGRLKNRLGNFYDFLKDFISVSFDRDLAFRRPAELYFTGNRDSVFILGLLIFIKDNKLFAEKSVVDDVHFNGLPFTAQIFGKIGCVFLEFLALVINQSAVSTGTGRGTNCYRCSDLRRRHNDLCKSKYVRDGVYPTWPKVFGVIRRAHRLSCCAIRRPDPEHWVHRTNLPERRKILLMRLCPEFSSCTDKRAAH